jgi:hypothetical protein
MMDWSWALFGLMVLCACAGAVLATCLWIVLGAVLAARDAVGPENVCRPARKCSGYWTAPHTLVHTDACPLTGVHPDNEGRGGYVYPTPEEARLLTLAETEEQREAS